METKLEGNTKILGDEESTYPRGGYMQKAQKINVDEITLFDLYAKYLNWDKFDLKQRGTIGVILTALLSCVENESINTNKLAELAAKVSGGKIEDFIKKERP